MVLTFLKIVNPGDIELTLVQMYDINPAFGVPADNSPCIKYKHGIHVLQKE